MLPMNRRDALKLSVTMIGAAAVGSTGALAGCTPDARHAPAHATAGVLTPDDQALVAEIADTLLPTTAASPGAKAAGAGAAIQRLLTDCYELDAQQRAIRGLAAFRATCQARHDGAAFAALSPPQREQLLRAIDADAQRVGNALYFALLRELAERTYFSSEVGMTRALRYVRVPGHWSGCVPLAPGQPAWG